MEAVGICSSRMMFSSSPATAGSPLFIKSMATPKSGTRVPATRRGSTVFPLGEPGPRQMNNNGSEPIKLLTNVEKLRLLTKAEKAGLLTAAENFGLSLSTVERLGLLSKAEELGVLSAATDPATPGTLLSISLALLVLGPVCVFVVPEQYPWEVALQIIVALVCVVGGSAAFAASNFVSNLQKSN
ncbi:unnamed protein product [Musa textilis]